MAQIDKNTVPSSNQLSTSEFVTFWGNEAADLRVMFVGNSITRHAPAPHIGWTLDCGMAASSPEKDYVHLLADRISAKRDAYFCICQVASWERSYKNGSDSYQLYEAARRFEADIIIMRAVENCPHNGFDGSCFETEYKNLIYYLNGKHTHKIILTSSFWKHPADDYIENIAGENSLLYIKLNDLGELDEMKAIGLFEHSGVASHPGDTGMQTIADRIWDKLCIYI